MLLDLLLVAAALPVIAAAAYLLLLAALARNEKAPPYGEPGLKFDFIVPAHDEERGIAETVRALSLVDYPVHLRRIRVVADNCTDETAARAREAGADVLERTDPDRRGKGYALAFAFERSLADGFADAVVVVDADTVVSPNLLRAFAARLERGEVACQAHYGVRNPNASWRTRLMVIALALFHKVRSSGRERLGVSCGLRGNGMCFAVGLLRKVPHDSFSIVEDLEYGIRLGRASHRVCFVHEADVLGEMVAGERASRSQRRRWEDGRRQMARTHGLTLLRDALSRRSALLLDLALDVLVPPLSRIVALAFAGTAASAAVFLCTGRQVGLWMFALADAMLAAYVLKGWWMSDVGPRGLVDLLFAPFYMAWKAWLLLRRSPARKDEWVRTAREGETR